MEMFLDINLVLFTFGILILSVLTTISGIGGGGIFIPYLMFSMNFSLLESVPLAITIILADCIVRMLLLYKLPNPNNPERYLMDLTPSNIIVPFDALFSWIGVILLKVLPNIITIVVVIILSIISIIKIGKTARRELNINSASELPPEIDGIEIYYRNPIREVLVDDRLKNLLLIILSVLLVGLFGIRERYSNCSLEYWLLILGNVLCLGVMCVINSKYVIKQYENRRINNFNFVSSDIVWNRRNILLLGVLSSVAGVLSTWLGLGGSSLITPILYSFRMKPEVISVSIGVSTLFSSLISLLNFIFTGSYLYKWGLLLFIISLVGSTIGIILLKYIIRYCRKGVISLLVIVVMIISVISLFLNIYLNSEIDFVLNSYCD